MAELFLLRRLSHDDNYDYSLGRFRCNAGRRLRALGLGADRLLASFGRVLIRTITFGRIRIESDADETRAMAVSAATLLLISSVFSSSLHACTDVVRPDKILPGRLGEKVRVACLGRAQVFLGFRKVGMET